MQASKGWFYDAHRAEVECYALLAVLSAQLITEQVTGLTKIIQGRRTPSYRLNATQAPFDAKDLLKAAEIAGKNYNRPIEMYIFVAIIYFVICFTLSQTVKRLQKRVAIIR